MAGTVAASRLSGASARAALRVRLAEPHDEPALRRLLRESVMDGIIRLTLEREPNLGVAAAAEGEPHASVVVERMETGLPVAMGSRATLDAYVDATERRLGYLSQLRFAPGQKVTPRALAEGFALLREAGRADEEPYDLTTIMADNVRARRLLEAGLPRLPRYRALGTIVTLVLPTGRRRRAALPRGLRIASASDEDLEAVAACLERNGRRHQFARRWTASDLRSPERCPGLQPRDFKLALRGDTVVACLAVWDQRPFKQVVVRGYAPGLARWRPWVNLAGAVLGWPPLPPPGQLLSQVFVSHVAVDGDAPETFAPLLEAALAHARQRGAALVVLGFDAEHPLLQTARRRRRGREYASLLYAVHRGDRDDALAALAQRRPHLEVALL